MKVSKEQMAEHRELILTTASRRFRDKGFDGVSVAGLMKEAGLTHGGFYNHFESKEHLIALATRRAFDDLMGRWAGLRERNPAKPSQAIIQTYLSYNHYRKPESGCVVAALGTETARQAGSVKTVMAGGIEDLLKILEDSSAGRSQKQRRKRAVTVLSQMIGAMVLARSNNNQSLAREILTTVSESLTNSPQRKSASTGP